MRTRNVWLAVILLAAASISLQIAVNGLESTWLDAQSEFFRTVYSPITLLAAILVFAASGAGGILLADYKLRPPLEGFFLGLLLGPLGILIEAALPDLGAYPRPDPHTKR